jgi:DNA-directed RNA polymerase subunit RPC12/RpoP
MIQVRMRGKEMPISKQYECDRCGATRTTHVNDRAPYARVIVIGVEELLLEQKELWMCLDCRRAFDSFMQQGKIR